MPVRFIIYQLTQKTIIYAENGILLSTDLNRDAQVYFPNSISYDLRHIRLYHLDQFYPPKTHADMHELVKAGILQELIDTTNKLNYLNNMHDALMRNKTNYPYNPEGK
jgi:hypothetical protein